MYLRNQPRQRESNSKVTVLLRCRTRPEAVCICADFCSQ